MARAFKYRTFFESCLECRRTRMDCPDGGDDFVAKRLGTFLDVGAKLIRLEEQAAGMA